jgi:predicted secreted Zn-dependent protease
VLLRRGVIGLFIAVLLAGCGGSSGGTAAPPASPSPSVDTAAMDTAAVTQAWQTFFTAGGPVDSHIALLQDGEKFRTELTASAKDPANKDLVAKVTTVAISGSTAAVTYDLLGTGGTVLLGGSMGEAVKVGTTWLVSKKTYCQLIQLQDSSVAHPGCSA